MDVQNLMNKFVDLFKYICGNFVSGNRSMTLNVHNIAYVARYGLFNVTTELHRERYIVWKYAIIGSIVHILAFYQYPADLIYKNV